MRNHEITREINLLDEQGNLTEPGFARKPYWIYNRKNLPASRMRIKEWDYYLIFFGQAAMAFTISDLGYIRMASVSFIDFDSQSEITKTVLAAPALSWTMPDKSSEGIINWKSKDVDLRFESTRQGKHIWCEWKKFSGKSNLKADIWLSDLPEESMVIATPFDQGKHFYYNQKMNNMAASGKVIFNWHLYSLDPKKDMGVMDWGRGYWPWNVHWLWGTCSTVIKGKPFGFSIGYGFGNTSAASENVLYYQGKIHKLDDVVFEIPENPMETWKITSSDGRFEAFFTPKIDRAAKLSAGPVHSDQHQYFGLINGKVILDSGRTLWMEHLHCAFENIYNQY